MEQYILIGLCFAAWLATVIVFKFLIADRELSFIVGSLAGLIMAAAAGGFYFVHLSSW